MPDPAILGLFMVAAMAILLIPGPTVLFVVTCSLNHGRQAGLVSVLGVEVGGLLHVLAATAGLSALLVSSDVLFGAVKFLGAAYLVYLGIQTLLDSAAAPGCIGSGTAVHRPPSLTRVFWQGALIDALNPKTALFFLAFLPQFIRPESGAVAAQTLVLGLIFLALAVVNDGLYALLAARLRGSLNVNRVFAQRRRYLTGGIYLALGLGAATEMHWNQAAHHLTRSPQRSMRRLLSRPPEDPFYHVPMPLQSLPVAGVLLAAGRSTRMGRPKQLALLNGQPLCLHAAQALAAVHAPLLAVIPPGEVGEGIRAALAHLPFAFAVNPQPQRGLASSFRVAAEHLPSDLGGATFALADMPLVTAELHRALLAAFRETNAPVVMAAYGDGDSAVRAPPHLLRADLLPQLLTLTDADHGPRRVMAAHGQAALTLNFPAEMLLDVDTPEGLERAEAALKGRG